MLNDFARRAEQLLASAAFAELERLCRSALATDGGDLDAHTFLAVVCQRQHRLAEAQAAAQAALAIVRDAERCYRLGDICHDLGERAAALAWLEEAVGLDAGHRLARYTLAVVLQDLGRHAEAIPHYQQVLAAEPAHAKALNNLGVALQNSGRDEAAIAAYRQAVAANPQHLGAVANLGGLLGELGEFAEARHCLAAALAPAAPSALDLRAALLLPVIPESRQQIDDVRAAMEQALDRLLDTPPQLADPLREVGRTPFYLSCHGLPNRRLLEKLAAVYRRACPALTAPVAAPPRQRLGGGRRRIGFASFLFDDPRVGRVVDGLIERLPRDRFEVVVAFLGGVPADYLVNKIASSADRAIQCGYDLDQARQTIAELDLDVLCFPEIGLDPLSYFTAFARLAPVQCTSWGQPETSGLDSIDYYVSTERGEPESAEAAYSERLIRLAGVAAPACYARPNALPGRSRIAGGPSIYCPQNLFELHPDFDALVARLLAELPTAKLYLVEAPRPGWTQQLQRRLAGALQGAAQRVVWLAKMSREDHLATLTAADLVLDPPHGSGAGTALEALAIGKPIVTLRGSLLRARMTSGFYEHIGFTELVAADADDYVARAVRLATDAEFRQHAGATIKASQATLFGDQNVVDAWTRFLDRTATAH